MTLDGKVALVTGGGTGIGKAIAKAISDEGGKVVIVGRKEENLKQAQGEIGSNIETMVCDVTQESQVVDVFSSVKETHGKLDILINNAGMAVKAKSHELEYELWKKVIDVNLNGAFLCAKEAMKIMVEQKSGRIINIGSISGQMSRPENAPYTSSKFGLEGLTRAFALDGRDHGVAVSIIHPGNVATNIWKGREEISEREGLIPLEDIGKLAVTMLTMSPNINILGSVILPITQPYLGRG